jgi:hypothetical protein
MHFEILVEDSSGKVLLEAVLPRILGPQGEQNTWRVMSYRGIGKLPPNMKPKTHAKHRILLDQLPRLLAGFGHSMQWQADAAVVVVVDADDADCRTLKQDMLAVHAQCNPKPRALFRIAVEEMEAWLLGDLAAVKHGYPSAKDKVLQTYCQDAVCGTWELLAEAIFRGGAKALETTGYHRVGQAKHEWAATIGPLVDVEDNRSRSFQVFREGLRGLAGQTS